MNKWSTDLMNAIGITDHTDIEEPLIDYDEEEIADTFFIKFMSDFGKRDDEQGAAFQSWANQNMVQCEECSSRSFIVGVNQFESVFQTLPECSL